MFNSIYTFSPTIILFINPCTKKLFKYSTRSRKNILGPKIP